MSTYSFKFSPSLLQSFSDYLDAENIYDKYFSHSENMALSYEDYERQKFQELIDRINRVPFENESSARGSCLNEIVDCIVMGVRSTRDDISVKTLSSFDKLCEDGAWDMIENKPLAYEQWFVRVKQPCIWARKGEYEFYFDIAFCKRIAEYFAGSLCQVYCEAPIETKYGTVLLYGFPDYIRGDVTYDMKTTSRYEFLKYSRYWQQHVYPYILLKSGKCAHISAFEFTAFQLKGGTDRNPLIYGEMYPEVYVYNHDASESLLRGICEQFSEFLINNKQLITDKKIFGGERNKKQ